MCWEGLSPLTPFLGHPDPKIRRIVYLDHMHSTHPSSLDELKEIIETERDLVLQTSIKNRLQSLEQLRAAVLMEEHLKSSGKSKWNTSSLKTTLNSFKTALQEKNVAYIPFLKGALNKYDDSGLKACFLRLCALLEFDHFEEIRKYLKDRDPRVTMLTCELLNSLGSSKCLASLLEVLDHPVIPIRRRVYQILMSHGHDFLSILSRDVIKVKPDLARIIMTLAIKCATSLNSSRGQVVLINLLSDPDKLISELFKEVFQEIYQALPGETQRHLNLVLNENNDFKLGEIIAFRNWKSKGPSDSNLTDKASLQLSSSKVSLEPASLIEQMRGLATSIESDQKKLRIFMNYLYHPHSGVRLAALEWLGTGLPNSLINILIPTLQDQDAQVRYSAAQILLKREQNPLLHEQLILECAQSLVKEGQESLAVNLVQELKMPQAKEMQRKLAGSEQTLPEIGDESHPSHLRELHISLPQKNQIFSDPYQFILKLEEAFEQGKKDEKIHVLKSILNYEVIPDDTEVLFLIRRVISNEQDSHVVKTLMEVIAQISPGDEWDLLEPFLSSEEPELRKSAVKTLSKLGDLRVLPHLMEILEQAVLADKDYEVLENSFEILKSKRPDLGILVISRFFDDKNSNWPRIRRILETWEFPPTDLNQMLIKSLEKGPGASATSYILSYLRQHGGKWDIPPLEAVRSNIQDSRLRERLRELEAHLLGKGRYKANEVQTRTVQELRWLDLVSWKWILPSLAISGFILWYKGSSDPELSALPDPQIDLNYKSGKNLKLTVKGPFFEVLSNPGWLQTIHENRIVYIQAKYEQDTHLYKGSVIYQGPLGALYLKPD